jgi:hypothetical protein
VTTSRSRGREVPLRGRIRRALEAEGLLVLTQHGSARTGKGRSDLIIPLLCLEVKNATGVVSSEQEKWLRRARHKGVPAYTVYSIAEARAAVALTRKGYVPMADADLDLDLSFLDDLGPVKEPEPAVVAPPARSPNGKEREVTLDSLLADVESAAPEPTPKDVQEAKDFLEAEDVPMAKAAVIDTSDPEFTPQSLGDEQDASLPSDTEAYVRKVAEERGIDSDIAVQVAVQESTVPSMDAQQRALLTEIANTYGLLGQGFIKMAALVRQYYGIDPREAPEMAEPTPRRRRSRAKTEE